MNSITPVSASMYTPADASPAASGARLSSGDPLPIAPAATLELSILQQQSQSMSTLPSRLSVGGIAAPSLFAGGSMLSALNAQGSAATAYITPLAAAGQNVDATA
jgi:hypothetical protein